MNRLPGALIRHVARLRRRHGPIGIVTRPGNSGAFDVIEVRPAGAGDRDTITTDTPKPGRSPRWLVRLYAVPAP